MFVTLLRIEYWPLTGIPMYSLYRNKQYNYAYIRDKQQALYLANEYISYGYPNTLAWSNQWVRLVLYNNDTKQEYDLRPIICSQYNKHGVIQKQWRRLLHNVAATQLYNQYSINENTDYGKLWLQYRRIQLKDITTKNDLPDWTITNNCYLTIYMPLKDGSKLIVAQTDWN